jgi:hypothetical protein
VTKRPGSVEERPVFKCSNPVCGRTFSAPLKLVDSSANDSGPRLACPICLGPIASDAGSNVDDSATNVTMENLDGTHAPEQPAEIERTVEGPKTECAHYIGFLSERSSKEKISEECMVCENIVKCMLKSVRG